MKFSKFKQLSTASFLQHFAWIWMRLFMAVFCRAKIMGRENLKKVNSNVIIASNHSNELDPVFLVASLPFFSHFLPLSFVSRSRDFYAHMSRGSIYGGKFFELMGAYPVYPGIKNYEKSLQHHIDAINHGRSVAIFPMGKMHSLEDISGARGGVSYLAYKTGLPIIPVRIDSASNTKLIDYLKFKCKITLTFGQPLYIKDIYGKNITVKKMESHSACEKAAVVIMEKIAKL